MTKEEANYVAALEQRIKDLEKKINKLECQLAGDDVFETKYHNKPDTIYYWGDLDR